MRWILFYGLVFNLGVHAQKVNKRIRLASELNEISGLALLNDSVLMAVNDSGNLPYLFFIDVSGKILKKTRILKAQNIDWEDMTVDERGNLYLADVGNNLNNRKDLHVLKLSAIAAFNQDTISAKEIRFSYPDQKEFPPRSSEFGFDCEAVFWASDSLYMLTKNKSKASSEQNSPWDREPKLYAIPDIPGTYRARITNWQANELFKSKKRGLAYLVTSASVRNNRCYVLTYKHLFIFKWSQICSERAILFHKKFPNLKQREAVAVSTDGTIYIGAEKHLFLGGPFLYIRKQK
jgi:hypothetical protein